MGSRPLASGSGRGTTIAQQRPATVTSAHRNASDIALLGAHIPVPHGRRPGAAVRFHSGLAIVVESELTAACEGVLTLADAAVGVLGWATFPFSRGGLPSPPVPSVPHGTQAGSPC